MIRTPPHKQVDPDKLPSQFLFEQMEVARESTLDNRVAHALWNRSGDGE